MRVPVSLRTSYSMADKKALVDSGATNNFIHPRFAERMQLGKEEVDTTTKNMEYRWDSEQRRSSHQIY
jgi:hypothetical protein